MVLSAVLSWNPPELLRPRDCPKRPSGQSSC